ncbi:MAG: FtsW/RodA/SpoVE family cell cycle protein [Tenericutes bacterium]|nr:FtsW/RodA/SpoVE family cell cycle protein [Mycoplasmatota bacterium]
MKKYIVKVFKNLNKSLFFWTMLYAIGGAFLILDASLISATLTYGYDNPYHFFIAQLAFIVVSLIGAYIIIKFIPTKIYGIASIFIGGILIVALVGTFGGNWIGNGVRAVTLQIGGFTLQPAEFLKIALIMFMGSFYYYRSKNPKLKSWWWLALIPSITVFAIVMFGGDFGTAAIIAALSALIFVAVPTSKEEIWFNRIKRIAIIGLVGSVLALKLGYLVIPEEKLKSDYRLNRFIYTNPCDRYEENSGYQVCNGFIAIDNGGLKGVGIGNSVQKYLYLPASHTDFIFPIVVEELGSIVGVLIIVGFMYIIALIFRVASSSYNLQNSIICYGIGINLMLHIFVNLGGVLGIIPLTGVPLPFLSYGGSFCITTICSLALVQRIHIENKEEKKKREINKIVNR